MQYLLLAVAALSVVMLYLLALATGNATVLAEYFWWVLGVNGLLLLALVAVVVRQIWQLYQNIRKRVFGAQLARKLAFMFAAVAILPGILLFAVSAQFISHSIASWFGDDTELALERGLRLSKATLELSLDETVKDATQVQTQLSDSDAEILEGLSHKLNELKQEHEFTHIALYRMGTRQLLGESDEIKITPASKEPIFTKELEQNLIKNGMIRSTESARNKSLESQVWLIVPRLGESAYVLYVRKIVPDIVAQDALLIEEARTKYAQLKYAKEDLQTFFIITLLIASLLAITLALAGALFFSQRFTAPLFALAAGARAVAQGDYSQRSPVFRQDELGMLSSLFNRMTEQLEEARGVAESNRKKQEAARAYLESVLASLSAGVVAFSAHGRIRATNLSAEQILGIQFEPLERLPWQKWVSRNPKTTAFVDMLRTLIEKDSPNALQVDYLGRDTPLILLAKATKLPEHMGSGVVLVFDDVTELVRAQKDAAWGEVAKRLAHEIRNPLTPIQLSAERLAMKLSDKLSESDAAMLHRATDTIVKQVTALKGMVEAFRNYARIPIINAQRIDLNEVVCEVLILYEESSCKITQDLSTMPLYIHADAAMLRQVLHNLLQNAQDAVAEVSAPVIRIFTYREKENAVLCVEDNGHGFEQSIVHQIFEPYITNKKTGTGLGLAVVKKIVDEHQGNVSVSSVEPSGALIKVILPLLEV